MSGDPVTGKEAADIGLVTMSVPLDKLEETVTLVAKRLTMVPGELLFFYKFGCNKCAEIMGMRVAMEFLGQMHDYSHTFDSVQEFGRVRQEQGVDAALRWRDAKFGDDYRALKAGAAEKGTDYRFPQVLFMPETREAIDRALAKYEAERKKQG